ncbi:MAG: HYR domain-containing protein, partial [Bacteroidales bacterium]|nr:HYR domain-containing protein [Bacteroidales bacterium]
MSRFTLILALILISFNLKAQIVSTIAGNGNQSCDYNLGQAISQSISSPMAVVADDLGNKFIADKDCHVIWKLNSSGLISVFAGNGNAGNSGDGNAAIEAEINQAYGLCFDGLGNLYFSDYANGNIRSVNLETGIINTLASGLVNPMHIASNTYGEIFVVNASDIIKKINPQTSQIEDFIQAQYPVVAIAIDLQDNIYYSTQNGLIYFYNSLTSTSELIAGTGNANYNGENIDALSANISCAYDLCFDNSENLVFVDTDNFRIRRLDKNTNQISTILGNGTNIVENNGTAAHETGFLSCQGIYIDECNHLYYTDIQTHILRKSESSYTEPDMPILSIDNYCLGAEVIINIQGNLNDAEKWILYSYGCGSIVEATSTENSISFTPNISDTYYVRGEGVCIPIGLCTPIQINLADQAHFILHPVGTSFCEGQTHTMTVNASGGIGDLTYFWEESYDGENFVSIENANSTTYTSPVLNETKYYRCRVESEGIACNAAYSQVATVHVSTLPENDLCANAELINSLPFNSGIKNNKCASNDVLPESNCVSAYNNLWFKVQGTGFLMQASTQSVLTDINTTINVYTGSCNNLTEVVCNSFETENTQPTVQWCSNQGTTYYISVGGSNSEQGIGNFVLSLSDFPVLAPEIHQEDMQVCINSNIEFSASINQNANIIKWYEGSCGANEIGNDLNISHTITESTYIYAQAFSNICPDNGSSCSFVYVTAIENATITNQPQGNIICVGGNHTMNIGATAEFMNLSYQWQSSNDGENFSNITGQTSTEFTTPQLNESTYYRCEISSDLFGCTDIFSDIAYVEVASDISFTLSPQSTLICTGEVHEMSVETAGGTPEVNLQWQYSNDLSNWFDIENASSNTYLSNPISEDTYFRVLASASGNGCENVYSNIASVLIDDNLPPVPNLSNLPDIIGECSIEITEFPTATDNCDGEITATTDNDLFYDQAGQYLIVWNYTDLAGNNIEQFQWIIVQDNSAPVPDLASLPVVQEECSANIENPPTATDNCDGTIIGTTNHELNYTQQGTYYIEWTFTDNAGNSSSQIQTLIVHDQTPPSIICADNAEVQAEATQFFPVSDSNFDPISFEDNCNVLEVKNNFNNSSTLYGEFLLVGVNNIEWTVFDEAGNSNTCTTIITVQAYVNIDETL